MSTESSVHYIGIDFGTTNTSLVEIFKNKYEEVSRILGDYGNFPFASMLAFYPDNRVAFGNAVKNQSLLSEIENCEIVSSFKSFLGKDKPIFINNMALKPKQIVSIYFECLKKAIKERFNLEIKEASFSFPVDFTPEARQDLRDAAEMAGITVTGMISESTAAYLAVREDVRAFSRVMVIDWGGGTLDVSILETENNKVRELAVYGEQIGGDDIDRALAERIHNLFNLKMMNEKADKCVRFDEMPKKQQDRMITACEGVKIQISEDGSDYMFSIRDYGDYDTQTVTITNEFFEDIVRPVIFKKVLKTIDTAMGYAGLTAAYIDAVIIAGGSSNLRQFRTAIRNLFGEDKVIFPDDAQFISGKGAALVPLMNGKFKLNDNVGIIMSDNTIFPILKKGEDGVGSKKDKYTFSLTEDSPDAHFIITNGDGKIIYDKVNIPTKGFLKERLEVSAYIDDNQVANIEIQSKLVSDELKEKYPPIKIKKLTYYYDLSEIDD